jgi:hypothetical protein
MNFRLYSLFFAFLLCGGLSAQHVDADSAYYTPIPKTYGVKVKKKKSEALHATDTIFSDAKVSSSTKGNYFFSLQTGSLVADGGDMTTTLSMLNGVTIGKKLRAGVGLGFDTYLRWKTVPLFGSVTWDVFGNKSSNAFFVQLNYGMASAWRPKDYDGYGRAEGGRMFSPQVGYRINYHDLRLSLALGARQQRVFSYYEYPSSSWRDGQYVPTTNTSTAKLDMSRFMFAMAIGWK